MNRSSRYAIVIAGLVIAASFVGVASPTVGAADARSIDSCRTLSESGVYELETNLTDPSDSAGACIEVESDDVVVDGNGHRISMTESDDRLQTPYAIRADGVENVTVRNLTTAGWGVDSSLAGTSLRFTNVSDVTVSNLVVPGPFAWNGITVRNGSDVTVSDVDLTGGGLSQMYPSSGDGIYLENVDGATVRNSTVSEWESAVTLQESTDVSLTNVTVGGVGDWSDPYSTQTGEGVRVDESHNVTIRESTVTQTYDGVVLSRSTTDVRVADNTLLRNRQAVLVLTSGEGDAANVIRNNTISENTDGVLVGSTRIPLRIVGNRIANGSTGVHVADSRTCGPGPEGGELVSVHGNVVANNTVGVENDGQDILDATRNYWGAASGPSSVQDADAPYGETDPEVPLEDPATGTLADGAGDAVTEFPSPERSGTSNVHFDPWLETSPASSGAQNATNETA